MKKKSLKSQGNWNQLHRNLKNIREIRQNAPFPMKNSPQTSCLLGRGHPSPTPPHKATTGDLRVKKYAWTWCISWKLCMILPRTQLITTTESHRAYGLLICAEVDDIERSWTVKNAVTKIICYGRNVRLVFDRFTNLLVVQFVHFDITINTITF